LAVSFSHPKKNLIKIELHHGSRKSVATLRTVRTLINNLIIGVTKGYKYKMRYVYAHFPINVNIEKNNETDQYEVEIRNFIGEKLVRRVVMRPGVNVEASKNQKDELQLTGNVSVLLELTMVQPANGRLVPRGCFPVGRRHPADLQGPQQGYPKVLGRSLRLGARQHRGGRLSDSREYEYGLILSRAYERLRVSLHHGLRSAPWGINFKTDVQYHHTVEKTETQPAPQLSFIHGDAAVTTYPSL
jgi:hypothetical protein